MVFFITWTSSSESDKGGAVVSETFLAVCIVAIVATAYTLYQICVAVYMLGCFRKFNHVVDVISHWLLSLWEDCVYDVIVVTAALVVIMISLYDTF
jgi:hypothetical protein